MSFFLFPVLLDFVITFSNVWHERQVDYARKKTSFDENELKSRRRWFFRAALHMWCIIYSIEFSVVTIETTLNVSMNMDLRTYKTLGSNSEDEWLCDNCAFPFNFTDSFFNSSTSSTVESISTTDVELALSLPSHRKDFSEVSGVKYQKYS